MSATIEFTNNLGTLRIERAVLSIGDEWQWENGMARHRKRLRVNGMMMRTSDPSLSEGPEAIITQAQMYGASQGNASQGGVGTLTLNSPPIGQVTTPWSVLEKMQMVSFAIAPGVWIDFMPVQVEFIDDDPDRHRYTINFFGMELHNARVSVLLPHRKAVDEFVQMPASNPYTSTLVNWWDPAFSPIRTRMTHDNCSLTISGFWNLPGPEATLDIMQIMGVLSQRSGVYGVEPYELPPGYPRVFDMVEVSDRLAIDLPFRKLIVTDSSLSIDVEAAIGEASVTLECLPQRTR